MLLGLLACQSPEIEYKSHDSPAGLTGDSGTTPTGEPYQLELVGELSLPGTMDVWGEGDTVVVAGGNNEPVDVLIADISDPAHPTQLATIEGLGQVRDVDLQNGILYAASDCNCREGSPELEAWDHVGIRLYDLSDPTSPRLLSSIGSPTESVHNLMVAEGYLYATSMLEGAVVIFDVSDPTAPVEVGRWAPPNGSVHDQTIVGDILYVAHVDGFSVLDVSDRSAPVVELTIPVATLDGLPTTLHNVWPLPDPRYVATSQEQLGGKLRTWDLESGTPLSESMAGDEPNCVHNAYTFGDRLYAAWYLDGVRVFDVTDPAAPALLGEYDTFPQDVPQTDLPNIRGAWGLWVEAGRIVVGDTERGLLVLQESGG